MPRSPAPARRRLSADERRLSILTAAAKVFGEVGYHRGSIDAVAEHTGISKPVVYDHFNSKPELYIAVLHNETAALLNAIDPEDPSEAPLEQRLARTARAMFSYARARPESWRLLFIDTVAEPAVEHAYQALRAAGADVAAGVTASDPDFQPPPGVDRSLAARISGQLQYAAYIGLGTWAHDHPEVTVDEVLAGFMDFVWVGLERLRTGRHWDAVTR